MKAISIVRAYKDKPLNCFLLAGYLSFLLFCQILVSANFQTYYLVLGGCMGVAASLIVAPIMIGLASNLNVGEKQAALKLSREKLRILFYVIPLFVLLLYYFAYYPGIFTPDSLWQYNQATKHEYNDWHPVLQTLLTFWLPLTLSGGWKGSVVLLQVLTFAAALGYSFDTIYDYAGKRFVIASMVFVLSNPLNCIAAIAWKDVSFAIGALLLMTFSLHIFMTKGLWLKHSIHMLLFIFAVVFTTIVRHNGILFTAPLLFAIFFQISRKRFLTLLGAVVMMFAAIKGPLYSALQVEKPDRRQVETLGLPMTVIGAVVTYSPETQEEDILNFAYQIAPRDMWESYYVLGDFNNLKYKVDDNLNVIEEYGAAHVLNMMMRCIKATPVIALSSLVKLTEGVFTITDPHPVILEPGMSGGESILCQLLYSMRAFSQDFLPHVFLYYGVFDLIVILSVLAKCRLNKGKDWKILLFSWPLLVFNFGTSLLLTGNSDSPRFFYYTVVILPVLIIFFYREEEKAE